MLGLLAVWPERLGAGCIGGASWAALLYCHFLAVPLSLSLLSPLSLPPVSGAVPWAVLALVSDWLADCIGWGCPLSSCWPWLLGWLSWVLALASGLLLPCVLSLSWVLSLGFGAAVSLCPLSWVLAFLCCPLVLACYALGLGAGLGWGRRWGCPGRGGGGWLGLGCGDLAICWFVMLHKLSLADLVIIQGKSDKF